MSEALKDPLLQTEGSIEAVVSLLDEKSDHTVRELWKALEQTFGLQGIYAAPFPHFSYHGSAEYDDDKVHPLLHQVAKDTDPFMARVSGYGIFSGPRPVLYLPVVRNMALSNIHQALWSALSSFADSTNFYYQPKMWMPHISLAYGDLSLEMLPEVVRFLGERRLDLEIPIDNLALVYAKGIDQGIELKVPLGSDE